MKNMGLFHVARGGYIVANDPFSLDIFDVHPHGKPESSGSIFSLSDKEFPELIRNAEAGDAKASFRLYQYYKFSALNWVESKVWLLKAAEQGCSVSQYHIAIEFFQKKDYVKALIWAKMAKACGSEISDSLIYEITENINSSL
ncbi:MAG TPA: hypothetical protein VN030_09200 [Cellvibrio sp.]|nr:hypothetical protein [Cellvibrio sp.]